MQTSTVSAKAIRTYLLLATLLFSTLTSFAHRVEVYSSTGCFAGNTITVAGVVAYAPSNTYYNWQYKDASGVWKCFTASSVINGTTFAVTNFQGGPAANAAPTLSIANATSVLENVQVRLIMSEDVRPCGAPAGTAIWGGDDQNIHESKFYRIHIYGSTSDCGGNTPGCLGNFLSSGSAMSNYYGGFESMVYNSSNSIFTNNNFISGAGSTAYTEGGNNSTAPATSGSGTYQVLNNPYGTNHSNGQFAPHSGNFQMVIDGAANTQKMAWYKTVTVVPGTIYNFSAWVARTQGTNAFNVKLTVNGTDIATSAVGTSVGVWAQVAGSYTVPAGVTSVQISVSDVSTAAERFFSLDDICFAKTSAVMDLGNRVFYDTNNNGINDGENGIQGVTVHLYLDANNDNVADGAAIATDVTDVDGFYDFPNLAQGNYIVGIVTPAGYMSSAVNGGDPDNNIDLDDNGQVIVGNEIRGLAITLSMEAEPGGNTNGTYDFGLLPDCACTTSTGNLLVNGSFENGTTGWTASGGTLTTGTGYIACGSANGFNNWSSGTSNVYQDVATMGGAVLTFKGFAGTHTPGISCSPKLSLIFLNSAGTILSQISVNVTRDVDLNHSQLEQYTLTGTAPAGTTKVRVQSSITCNTMKVDAFCLTAVNPTYTLGNTVWNDKNNNGTQETGEPGLQGAVVKLYDCSGNYLNQTMTTDVNGNYLFTALPAGSYIVGVTPPAGYAKSDVGATNVATDNQNDGVTTVGAEIRTACFTTTGSTNNIDFGLKGTGSIGDFVWNDTNGNGVQDSGEPGINGVTVTLTGTGFTTQTTTTAGNGAYSFTNLSPNTYTVTFTTPAGLTPTTANVPSDDTKDSDPVNGAGVSVVLAAGQTDNTIDAGYYTLVSIGNTVWNDRNNNGTQDPNEPGIQGVVVKLYDCAGNYLNKTFTTDANGNYTLAGVAPGSYIVGITTPAGYAKGDVGTTDVTTDNKNDGTVATATEVRTTCFSVTTTTTNIDFGLKGTGSIGDFVFNDANGNGIQDAGEVGIGGATVTLTYPGGATLVTTTGTNGIYTFANLAPGTYSVTFTTPTGLLVSPSNVTTAGATDLNDSDPVGGVVSGIVLTAGQINTTIDAGFYSCTPPVSGINGPSTICANEPALFTATPAGTGSVYTWTFMSGTPATFTGSSATPYWTTPGEYDITLTVSKNGCSSTYLKSIIITQAVYAGAGPDADICQGSSVTLQGSGPAGANYSWTVIAGDPTSIDNGASQMAVLVSPLQTTSYQLTVTQNGCSRTDTVVVNINVNKNPTADAGPDKTILINTAVTIGGSPTGTPPIAAPTAPLGYIWSPATNLNSSTVANPSATFTAVGVYNYRVIVYSTLTGCSDSDYVAITAVQPVSLGNTVWNDINNNGIKDPNESGVGGVTVKLYMDADNNNVADGAAIATTTTNGSGVYAFTNLYPSNNYIVGIMIPQGYTSVATNGGDPDNNIDNDNNGTNTSVAGEIRSSAITLTAGGEPATAADGDDTNGNQTLDFALRGTASLGDRVFQDLNRNGIQDPAEIGIGGAGVTLTYANGATVSTTTNTSGIYTFNNLAPGTYSVTFSNPGGAYVPTLANVTTAGATDLNDSDPSNGTVSGIVLTAGQVNTSVDAGFYKTININGHVWNDVNGLTNNEINNTPNATPIPQFLNVYLVDANTNLIVQAETVNTDGTYMFENVDINTSYIVVVSTVNSFPGLPLPRPILPAGWIRVGENLGAGPNSGSDGIIDGQLYIDTDTNDVFNANFGIQNRNGEIVIG